MSNSHTLRRFATAVLSFATVVGCQSPPVPPVRRGPLPREVKSYSAQAMGGLCRIQLVTANSDGYAASLTAFEEARWVEGLFNLWSKDSEISRWNKLSRESETGKLRIHSELAFLLRGALRFSELSSGAFDPTVGSALRQLGFYADEPTAALDDESRARWKRTVGADKITELDLPPGFHGEGSGWYIRRERGVEIDLSAMAKGYAAELMAEAVREGGFETAIISAGTSSVVAFGAGPEGKGWPFELPHPDGVRTWWLRDEAVSTSGQSSLTLPGANEGRSHIFDPRTLAPVNHRTEMVVVRGKNPVVCDMLSTALLVLGVEEGSEFFREFEWGESGDQAVFYSVAEDGSGPEIRTLTR